MAAANRILRPTFPGPHRSTSARLALALVGTLGAVATAHPLEAQRPSSWASIQPAGGVNPTAISQLGKLVHYRAGTILHVYSASTRQWHTRSITSGATLRYANDWLLVIEPRRITGFSALRGQFVPLTVSPNAQVLNPTSQRNDSIALIGDGNTLSSFSGLTGTWNSLRLSGAPDALSVQRHTAVIAEGGRLYGLSALTNDFHVTNAVEPVQQLAVDGTAGLALTPSLLHGFSAQRGTWTLASRPIGGSVQQTMDTAIIASATECVGFSGLRGAFAKRTIPSPASVSTNHHLGSAVVGNDAHLFSAITANWITVSGGTTGISVQLDKATALLTRGSDVLGYSAMLDSVTTLAGAASSSLALNASLAYSDHNGIQLFSAFTGQWHPAPTGSDANSLRHGLNGAVLRTGTGQWAAWSARSGRYVSVAAADTAMVQVDGASSVLALQDGTKLWAFAPAREQWLSTTLQNASASVSIWRTTMIVDDTTRAIGFGSQSATFESIALPEPTTNARPSSESGRFESRTWLHAYSPVPDIVTQAQFPEFRRIFVRDSDLGLSLRAAPGASAVGLFGTAARTPLTFPGLDGQVLIDVPSHLALPFGTIPADGHFNTKFLVPDVPQLRNLEAFFQGAVLPRNGTPYVTRMTSARLL